MTRAMIICNYYNICVMNTRAHVNIVFIGGGPRTWPEDQGVGRDNDSIFQCTLQFMYRASI